MPVGFGKILPIIFKKRYYCINMVNKEHESDHNQDMTDLEIDKRLEKFQEQQEVMAQIKERGGFAAYVKNLPNLSEAFYDPGDKKESELVRVAGSGILLPKNDLDAFLDKCAQLCRHDQKCCVCCMDERLMQDHDKAAHHDFEVSWHKGCGAAAKYCKDHNIDPTQADAQAQKYAESLAEKLSFMAGKKIEAVEMKIKNPDFHYARVCYYDATNRFNNEHVQDLTLPEGLIVGRDNMSPESAIEEARIAIGIMLGEHGFGNLFTPKDPFVLVAIGNTPKEVEALKSELEKLKSDRVIVEGFVAPKLKSAADLKTIKKSKQADFAA